MSVRSTVSTKQRRLELEARRKEIDAELEELSSRQSRYSPTRSNISAPSGKLDGVHQMSSSGNSLPLGQGSGVSPQYNDKKTPPVLKGRVMKMSKETRAARKARRRISPEFVRSNFSSDSGFLPEGHPSSDSHSISLTGFKKLCQTPDDIRTVLLILDSWTSGHDSLFLQSATSGNDLALRSDFIKTITDKLQAGIIKFLSPEFELALIIVKNPLLRFHLCSFVNKPRSEINPHEFADAVRHLELVPNDTVVVLDHNVPDLPSLHQSSLQLIHIWFDVTLHTR